MKLRRLIRIFCASLLLTCIGLWIWSYTGTSPLIGYTHESNPNLQYMAKLDRGTLHLCTSHYCSNYPLGLFCESVRWKTPRASKTAFWGFYMDNDPNFFHWSGIPLWFPTALSAAISLLAWRKTRSPLSSPGFPVVLHQESKPA